MSNDSLEEARNLMTQLNFLFNLVLKLLSSFQSLTNLNLAGKIALAEKLSSH